MMKRQQLNHPGRGMGRGMVPLGIKKAAIFFAAFIFFSGILYKYYSIAINLYVTFSQHSIGHPYKTGNISSFQVIGSTIGFFTILNTLLMNIMHDHF